MPTTLNPHRSCKLQYSENKTANLEVLSQDTGLLLKVFRVTFLHWLHQGESFLRTYQFPASKIVLHSVETEGSIHILKSTPLVPIPSQITHTHTPRSYSLKIHTILQWNLEFTLFRGPTKINVKLRKVQNQGNENDITHRKFVFLYTLTWADHLKNPCLNT
jgi:hypothetical protein